MRTQDRGGRFTAICLGAAALFGGASCATTKKAPEVRAVGEATERDAPRKMELEGSVVLAAQDATLGLQSFDAQGLFALALEAGDDAVAEAAYRRLLKHFPESAYRHAAAFNLGLLLEAKDAYGEASGLYQSILDAGAGDDGAEYRTWFDAHYRLGTTLRAQEAWWDAVGVYDELLALPDLDPDDKLEAMAHRALSIYATGERALAESALAHVVSFHRREVGEGSRNMLVAEAAMSLGALSKQRYEAVELAFPVSRLQELLEVKCTELLAAQHRYLRAVRTGDIRVAAAAGYQIGWLYEDLHDALVSLEVPDGLSNREEAVYKAEVKRRLQVLVRKALHVYQLAKKVTRQLSMSDEWVQKLDASIRRLQEISVLGAGEPQDASKLALRR